MMSSLSNDDGDHLQESFLYDDNINKIWYPENTLTEGLKQ